MPQIKTKTKNAPKFLVETPGPNEKEIWKKAYARYLHEHDKNPWSASKDRAKFDLLLPIL